MPHDNFVDASKYYIMLHIFFLAYITICVFCVFLSQKKHQFMPESSIWWNVEDRV